MKVDPVAKFFDHVAVRDGCWVWTAFTSNGYGQFRDEGKTHRAHRWLYERLVGSTEGLDLDHLCRNRACVNPAHLEPVTRSENLRRGDPGVVSLVCRRGHWKLGDNVYVIPGSQHRVCRECVRFTRSGP